jgi:hypothetical protein
MNFYILEDNLYVPANRWFLGNIDLKEGESFWKYLIAGEVDIPLKPLLIGVREEGIPLDFTMADFELPIVNEKVAGLLDSDEVQLIPVLIKKFEESQQYFLMVIRFRIACVDEEKSVFDKWEPGNSIRPDLAGNYKSIYKLVLNTEDIGKRNIFRLKKYNSFIIISEKLKNLFDKNKITGINYKKVT